MGYSHRWVQTRRFTAAEWADVRADLGEILSFAQTDLGIPLANCEGTPGTYPQITDASVLFNGVGDDACETFEVTRERVRAWEHGKVGSNWCKTWRKPYDVVVTACLCYLSSVTGAFDVHSDGHGGDFLAGLSLARQALPSKANLLDLPMGVMEDDRWTGPWIHASLPSGYDVQFCIDGKGYVRQNKTGQWYCFPTHLELGEFLERTKAKQFRRGGRAFMGRYDRFEPNIWDATGFFDHARHQRIARAQAAALAPLFPPDAAHAGAPMAFVRPGDFVRPEDDGTFNYRLTDLLQPPLAAMESSENV